MISWVRHGGGEELLNDLLKDHNYSFAAANAGAQMGGYSARKFRQPKI